MCISYFNDCIISLKIVTELFGCILMQFALFLKRKLLNQHMLESKYIIVLEVIFSRLRHFSFLLATWYCMSKALSYYRITQGLCFKYDNLHLIFKAEKVLSFRFCSNSNIATTTNIRYLFKLCKVNGNHYQIGINACVRTYKHMAFSPWYVCRSWY